MIALPFQSVAPRIIPLDTGCVFPFGANGRDVRIRLLTADPAKAAACGEALRKWGLPYMPEIVAMPRVRGLVALDLAARGVYYPELGREGPRKIFFGGDAVVLETLDAENIPRFARWYDEKARAAVRAKDSKPKSLTDLADAGEIETIDVN